MPKEPAQLDLAPTVAAPQQLAVQVPSPEPVLNMIQQVVNGGITESNVAALDKLLGVYERLEDKRAERDFNAAFVALQADLPVIVATSIIPNRGKYERFEDIMRVLAPLLTRHGFSVSFSMDFKDARIVETCHLRHIGGHSQSNSFAVRTGGKADSETQADCKAATTAKRNALLNCFNIIVRQDVLQDEDQDAGLEGAFIKPEQALYIRELVKETKSDEKVFLEYAGAAKYEEIGAARYDRLVAALHKKQKEAR